MLIFALGIFPAGLVLRMFVLNSLIRFRIMSVDFVVSNGAARALPFYPGYLRHLFAPGTIMVLSFVRCVACVDFPSLAAHQFLSSLPFADKVHSFSESQRRLMLLPVMILMGSRILGWDVVDMEIVMHVGLVDLTSLFFQNTLRV